MPNDSVTLQEPAASPATAASSCREVLEAARCHFELQTPATFVPGETNIAPSGKVMDADDLEQLVDTALDIWLAVGRFTERF